MGKDQRGNDDDTVVLAKMLEYQWQIMNPEKGLGFPGGARYGQPFLRALSPQIFQCEVEGFHFLLYLTFQVRHSQLIMFSKLLIF